MSDDTRTPKPSRRAFLKTAAATGAGVVAAGAARADDPMITEFRDWLFEEVRRDSENGAHVSAAE